MSKEKEEKTGKMSGQLSQQVVDTLSWIGDQYTVNWHHVASVYNSHYAAQKQLSLEGVRSLLRRLTDHGYLRWRRLLHGHPSFVFLTGQALAELELPYDPAYEPDTSQTLADGTRTGTTNRHKDQINQVRLWLETHLGRRIGWISERRLRLDREPLADGSYPHLVDGRAFLDGRDTAVEVERVRKGVRRLESIMLSLMCTYDQTYYFCTQPETYGLARRVATDLDPDGHRLRIMDWSELR